MTDVEPISDDVLDRMKHNMGRQAMHEEEAMTTQDHPPEPLRIREEPMVSKRYIARGDTDLLEILRSDADARRIVACVNALEGVPTKALEDGCLSVLVGTMRDIIRLITNHSHYFNAGEANMSAYIDSAAAVLTALRRERDEMNRQILSGIDVEGA